MSRGCDDYEVLVSSWIDGEIDPVETEAMLDHLVRCAACRRYYREARALGSLVERLGSEAAEPAPERLWEGIEAAAARETGSRSFRSRALRLAAVLVVAAGLAVAVVPRLAILGGPGPEPAAIAVSSAGSEMTDERFIELAVEVLEADARYQRAMYRAMEEVLDAMPREGGRDERRSSGERSREGERSGGRA